MKNVKFAAVFFFALFGSAQAADCSVDLLSVKSAIAAKHRIPTSNIVIIGTMNTAPSKAGYVETSVEYETSDAHSTKTTRLTVKGRCN